MEMDKKIQSAQPSLGTWDKLPSEEMERKPKVSFDINVPVEVQFKSNDPREYQGDNGAYYVFEVVVNGEEKVIMTSAWSLLRSLKILSPLQNKSFEIVKRTIKNKQTFEVKQI